MFVYKSKSPLTNHILSVIITPDLEKENNVKNLALGIGSIMFVLLIVAFSYVMINTSQRKTEVRVSTTEAMEQALSNIKIREYHELKNEKELGKYFSTYVVARLQAKNVSCIINIYDIDYEKGLIDAKCTVTYPTILGAKKLSVRKTLIADNWQKHLQDEVDVDD